MDRNEALFRYVLRLGDSSLILGQRLSEWTGHGPFLEEDLALTNIALDIFGRANSLLEYAGRLEGKGQSENDLAFHRDDRHFYNAQICELPNGDYAFTMLRQAFIDCFELLQYSALMNSADATLAGIAAKTVKEVTYHKRHSFSWVTRFGNGTEESISRLQHAFQELWPFTGELFESDEIENELVKANIAVDASTLKSQWDREIRELLASCGITAPEGAYMHTGGRKGVHTEHLGHLLAEMQALPRMYPDAQW
jgi:ring-1,2-phenylacetyl-CoA epoxidase subunit PaaC